MATQTATDDCAEFLRQPVVIRYLDEIANDSQSAIDIAKSNLSYKGLKHYPPKLVSTYKADLKALLQSEARFNAEYTKVGSGAAKSLDPFTKTYHTYLLNLEILEIQNPDHSALVEADLGLKLAALMVVLNEVSPLGAKYNLLNKETERLIKALIEANKTCRNKALTAALTLPLTILSSVVCPQRQLVRLAWRGGIAVTQGIINVTMANGAGKKELSAATGVGSVGVGLALNLKRSEPKIWKSLVGASVSIATAGAGVGMEAAKVKNLQAQIQAYMKLYKAVAKEFAKQTKGVMDQAKKAETAHATAVRNLGRANPKTAQRQKLVKEIKAWNK